MHPRLRTTYHRRAAISMKSDSIALEMPWRVRSHHSRDVAMSGSGQIYRRRQRTTHRPRNVALRILKRWSLTEPNLTPPRRNRRYRAQIHVDTAPVITGHQSSTVQREEPAQSKELDRAHDFAKHEHDLTISQAQRPCDSAWHSVTSTRSKRRRSSGTDSPRDSRVLIFSHTS